MKKFYSDLPNEEAGKEFIFACIQNKLDNVKEILSNKRLESNISKEQFCKGFNWAAGENYEEIINYLVLDYNIPEFEPIKSHIEVLQSENLRKMFANRSLIKELTKELESSLNDKIKTKI